MVDRRLIALLAVFTLVCLFQISTRGPVFNDEIINLARTEHGLMWGNLLDYSLRPFYRLATLLWRELYGPTLEGMWLGSVTTAILGAIALYTLGLNLGSRFAAYSGPLLLAASPEFVRVGLGNMPQLTSGIVGVLSLCCLVPWLMYDQTRQEDSDRPKLLLVCAALLAVLAMLTHPTQVAFLVSVIIAIVVAFIFAFIADDYKISNRTNRRFREAAITIAIAIGAILCVDMLYRVTLHSLPHQRLPIGSSYSYLNLWIGNTQAMDSLLVSYSKPFYFYWEQLVANYPIFATGTLALAFASVTVSSLRLRAGTSQRIDGFCMASCFIALLWLFIASIAKMKTDYTLAAWAPLAAAANVAVIAQLTGYFSGEGRLGMASSTIMSMALVLGAGASFASQRSAFQAEVRLKAPQLGVPYRLLAALPPGIVGVVTMPAEPAKLQRITNSCRNLAAATQRRVVTIHLDLDIANSENPIEVAGNPLVVCFAAELASSHAGLFNSLQIVSGYQKLLRSKKGVELWVSPPAPADLKAPSK